MASTSALLLVAGMSFVATASASAATLTPHAASTQVCKLSIASGSGVVVPGVIVAGVIAGSTTILIDCDAASGAAIVAEASILAAMGDASVITSGLADISATAQFTAAPTDTGCPAGVAGSCETATFPIPATFTSGDPNAVCPPSQAEINAGDFGCAIAVVNAQESPVAEYLIDYASQTAPPNAPTITALQSKGSAGSAINVADTAGATGYWWGAAIQLVQATATQTAPVTPPSSCTGTGYGDVPAGFLGVLWYSAANPTAPIVGSAAGVTISNDCYDGTTLHAPTLSGTITVPASVVSGTTYEVYLCEANTTPYPINDTTGACGAQSIDASFPFTAAAGVISQNLPQASTATAPTSSAFTDQLTTSGNTGAVTYTQTSGNPSIVVSSTGAVTTSGALAAGVYTATGTTSDTGTDTGTFTFALTVTAVTVTPPPAPKASKVTGEAIPGKTVKVVISGSGFIKGAKISGHTGTTATVLATTATRLTVRVKEIKTAKKGTYVFTIKFTSGKRATVKYIVK
ncbi:MAG TPA: hypothetical protein VII67_08155 [Acidimicrobiales bacterium]